VDKSGGIDWPGFLRLIARGISAPGGWWTPKTPEIHDDLHPVDGLGGNAVARGPFVSKWEDKQTSDFQGVSGLTPNSPNPYA
jgi:hypothetical protein